MTYLNVDRQVGMIKQTHTQHSHSTLTDKKVKTEGSKILSNYIFYFRTVIIVGTKTNKQTKRELRELTPECVYSMSSCLVQHVTHDEMFG